MPTAHAGRQLFHTAESYGFCCLTFEGQRTWAKKLLEPRLVNNRRVMELPRQLLELAKLLSKDYLRSPHSNAVANLLQEIYFLETNAEAKT